MDKTKKVISKYLQKGDTVILGLSGGADSMCLLSLLLENNINVIIAHVNHKVRKESDEEEVYICNIAKKYNLKCHVLHLKGAKESDFESYARKKRYAFFNELYEKYNAKYILTAHHADDEIETILMRISRGSNLHGYAGIPLCEGRYFRPLICTTKEKILEYNKDNHITYYNDYTNDLDIHTRNRFRHNIIPKLKEENPKVHEKFCSFSEELLKASDFLDYYIDSLNIIKNDSFNIKDFLHLHPYIQEKIVERIIKNYQKDYEFDVSKKNVEDILKLINSSKASNVIDLKNNFIAVKSYDTFKITKKNNKEDYEHIFSQKFHNDMFIINAGTPILKDDVIYLDNKDITLPLKVRNKRPGDVIEIKNLGHKKVSDIFIDNKIPLEERSLWPIITDANNVVLWLPNLKKSKFAKDKKEKYDIILSSERKINGE